MVALALVIAAFAVLAVTLVRTGDGGGATIGREAGLPAHAIEHGGAPVPDLRATRQGEFARDAAAPPWPASEFSHSERTGPGGP
jgi:hypothetical protein